MVSRLLTFDFPYICATKKTEYSMEEAVKKSTGKHWALFFFWTVAMFAVMFSTYGQWFWLILPFVTTEFAKAMDLL